MKVTKFTTCLFLITTLGLSGCESDRKAALKGRWEMKYAELNGQPAPLLEKMYFQFEGKNVTTNFNEATIEETTPYEFNDDKIIKKSDPPIEFEVTSLSDSILEMKTEMRGFDFKLVFSHINQ